MHTGQMTRKTRRRELSSAGKAHDRSEAVCRERTDEKEAWHGRLEIGVQNRRPGHGRDALEERTGHERQTRKCGFVSCGADHVIGLELALLAAIIGERQFYPVSLGGPARGFKP